MNKRWWKVTFFEQWPSGQGVGYPIQGSRVQNHWVAPWSTQPLILPRSIKWVPGISGNLVVKSKLPPRSGSSLEAVDIKRGHKVFCFFLHFLCTESLGRLENYIWIYDIADDWRRKSKRKSSEQFYTFWDIPNVKSLAVLKTDYLKWLKERECFWKIWTNMFTI